MTPTLSAALPRGTSKRLLSDRSPLTGTSSLNLSSPMAAMPIGLLTYEQAATYLNIRPGTLRNLVSAGKGPVSVQIGSRARRFRLRDLDAYIASRLIEPPKPPVANRRGRPSKAQEIALRRAGGI